MGDVTYVLYYHSTLTDIVSLSFGGGFEMMKAGGDRDGLWAVILDAMAYVSGLQRSACLTYS